MKTHRIQALALLALVLFAPAGSPVETPPEAHVKAAIIYNLTKFVIWPDTSFADGGSPIEVAVLGSDPVGSALDAFEGAPVAGRSIRIRHLPSLGALGRPHVLYVAASEDGRLPDVLRAASGRAVLTTADISDFARRGGMLNFGRKGDAVSLEINVGSARRSGIQISSKVLGLATIVSDEKESP